MEAKEKTTPELPKELLEEIEAKANGYAEAENSCFTNDYQGFLSGATEYAQKYLAEKERLDRAVELLTEFQKTSLNVDFSFSKFDKKINEFLNQDR